MNHMVGFGVEGGGLVETTEFVTRCVALSVTKTHVVIIAVPAALHTVQENEIRLW